MKKDKERKKKKGKRERNIEVEEGKKETNENKENFYISRFQRRLTSWSTTFFHPETESFR